jgi:hypothetical protein
MEIKAITVDEYLGFQYVIPTRLAGHQSPYVKIRWQDQSVGYFLLKTKTLHFYPHAPDSLINQKQVIEIWINKNYNLCKKVWNQHNEVQV